MTIGAPVMLQGIGSFTFVTLLAPDCQMLILKFKISFIMIKPRDSPRYVYKRILSMALTAILSKLVLMRVFMTTGAVTERHPPELLKFLPVYSLLPVALQTIDGFMFTLKRKPGSVVVKLRSRLK